MLAFSPWIHLNYDTKYSRKDQDCNDTSHFAQLWTPRSTLNHKPYNHKIDSSFFSVPFSLWNPSNPPYLATSWASFGVTFKTTELCWEVSDLVHNRTVELFWISENYGGVIKGFGRKTTIPISPFMTLIKKKKGGLQPPTLYEPTALPKL